MFPTRLKLIALILLAPSRIDGLSTSAADAAATTSAINTTTCNGLFYAYTELAGYGYIPSNARDKFGDTVGGIGSAIALDQSSWTRSEDGLSYTGSLWVLPDRGWNTEGTLNYVNRVHKFVISLTLQPNASVTNPAAPNVNFTYLDTILFSGPDGQYTTGLDATGSGGLAYEGFPLLPAANWTGDGFGDDLDNGTTYSHIAVDAEGLVINADGTFWVSDEYGPYIWLLNSNGTIISAIRPPEAIIPKRNGSDSFSADSPPVWEDQDDDDVSPADNPTGRDNNHGFEGLSASADGETLYVLLQAAANQEGGLASQTEQNARLVIYDVSDKLAPVYLSEYIVPLPFYDDYTAKASKNPKVAAQSEIHALPNGQFFVLARDSGFGHGQSESLSVYRHIDVFDVSEATDIAGATYDCETCAVADSDGNLDSDITPATYCSFLDFNVNSQLGKFGMHNGGDQNSTLLNEKWESIALAPVDPENPGSNYFVISLSDNDFITQDGYLNFGQYQYSDSSGYNLDNQALVFQVTLPS
ncbi:esterase-like activity of phytase-domain-containing protein [Coniella lustricola]|uniref:Esterase-like activity of phytase-domain-containing protein n=1 Tax=Coniella lustricola TaxID=2025994 RepID=A0A2T3A3T6_9PEZI|nr:esterase-like activity of phytase-domain-containing protein [Coniella lustricola]